jgi:hypothetical protein
MEATLGTNMKEGIKVINMSNNSAKEEEIMKVLIKATQIIKVRMMSREARI